MFILYNYIHISLLLSNFLVLCCSGYSHQCGRLDKLNRLLKSFPFYFILWWQDIFLFVVFDFFWRRGQWFSGLVVWPHSQHVNGGFDLTVTGAVLSWSCICKGIWLRGVGKNNHM